MVEVLFDGTMYYADIQNKILYTDRDKKNGTPFNYLIKEMQVSLENQIRFPKSKKEE